MILKSSIGKGSPFQEKEKTYSVSKKIYVSRQFVRKTKLIPSIKETSYRVIWHSVPFFITCKTKNERHVYLPIFKVWKSIYLKFFLASDHKTNLSDLTIFISKTKKGTYDLIFFNMPFNRVPNIVKGDLYVQ